jgi:hypothetical protein
MSFNFAQKFQNSIINFLTFDRIFKLLFNKFFGKIKIFDFTSIMKNSLELIKIPLENSQCSNKLDMFEV